MLKKLIFDTRISLCLFATVLATLLTAFLVVLLTVPATVLTTLFVSLASNLLIVGVEEGRSRVDPAGPGGVGIGGG